MIRNLCRKLFGAEQPKPKVTPIRVPTIVVCEGVPQAIAAIMEPERQAGEEGIAYLLGITTGSTTLITSAIRPPAAQTSAGSFFVDKPAMAKMVRAAADLRLQIVGQIHSHPGEAYHSGGDVEGARIAFPGFVSLVVPRYGLHLPELTGMAAYFFLAEHGFKEINPNSIHIAPPEIP